MPCSKAIRAFSPSRATSNPASTNPLNDLRDKRLLTFDQDKLSRVELIAKKQDIEFGRDKDQWQIVKPKPLRADGLQVDEMLRKLKDAKMDLALSADDAKKAAAAFASGMPVATVKLTDPSGTQQIEVRKVKDDYYAKSSVAPGVFKATPDLGTGVDKSLDDFRNKKLFDFGFNDPSKIEMHANGKTFVFQKGGEDWFANAKKMDSVSMQSFLDKVRDLSASKFVDTGTLGTPTIDIIVVSSKSAEKLHIAKQGADYIAQRENEPALYGLDAKTVDDLLQAASDVKPAPPAKEIMTGLLTDLYQLTMGGWLLRGRESERGRHFRTVFPPPSALSQLCCRGRARASGRLSSQPEIHHRGDRLSPRPHPVSSRLRPDFSTHCAIFASPAIFSRCRKARRSSPTNRS